MLLRGRPLLLALALSADPAGAQDCSATMSDLDFGTVTLRSGTSDETSGLLIIECTGVSPDFSGTVGVCIRLGAGSGAAAAGLSPRYMRHGDGSALAYEIRSGGAGAGNPTWRDLFVRAPTAVLGRISTVPVYGAIAQGRLSARTGPHTSTFSGAGEAAIDVDVSSCADSGTLRAIPDFNVSAIVANSCEVEASSLDFGMLSLDANLGRAAIGSLTVRCTRDTGYAVRMDNGMGAGAGGPTDRRMTGPNGQIRYGIYRDPAHLQPWGETGSTSLFAAGSGGDQTYGLYGRIAPVQNPVAGDYSDSVLVTVSY